MYNVSNDPRCQRSCNLIKDALISLLEEGDYNLGSIEVSDIAKRANVSRATFYRHFETTNDVLCWASNEDVECITDSTLLLTKDYRGFCKNFFNYWVENSDFLLLLVKVGHPDIFFNSIERSLTRASDRIFRGSRLSVDRQSYMITIWTGIVWSILKKWVARGQTESAEELLDIAMHNLPKPR